LDVERILVKEKIKSKRDLFPKPIAYFETTFGSY
jgi:hypothetical protein